VYELTADRINRYQYTVLIGGYHFEVTARTALQEKAFRLIEEAGVSSHKEWEVKAPMPGMILKIKKQKGELISKGESIMILEAMKMENDLKSPASGVIKNIFVKENTAVEKGTVLYSAESITS
jgi:biotin carboxyl carrier protein